MKLTLIYFLAALALPSTLLAQEKNVLLICVDDLKPVLGCYGDKIAKTPEIDKLAKRGLVFDNAYCNEAICAPSRHALMVGVRPQRLGIYNLSVNFRKSMPNARTLGQVLQENGYRAEGMGKIFHQGQGNGDDAATWSLPHYAAGKATKTGAKAVRGGAYNDADMPDDSYPDGIVASHAISRLEAAAKEPTKPFFIACGFIRPHLPFDAPKRYWDLYDKASLPLAEYQKAPDGAPAYATQPGGELRSYQGIPKQGALPEDLQRTLIHGYYASTSYMDAQVGRVMKALDDTKLASSTLVILWGDHGWHLGDHGQWCKHTNYEQATRIPLIMAGPGVAAGRSRALVETVDLFPTVLEWAEAKKPAPAAQLDGQSFAKTLADPAAPHRNSVTHVYPRGERLGRAIRTHTHRLVEWKVPGQPAESAELELYDYTNDPLEKKNVAAEQPAKVKELRAELEKQGEAKPQLADATTPTTAATPTLDRKALFHKKDANQDGKLDEAEFLKNQPDPQQAPKRFTQFDVNQDKVLSEQEFVTSGKRA